MSTYVHGYKADREIADLYEHLINHVKPKIKEAGSRIVNETIANRTVIKFDNYAVGIEVPDNENITAQEILSEYYSNIIKRYKNIKTTGHRDPEVDADFDIYLFPLEKHTFIVANTESRELLELFIAHAGVEEYSYWDSTDKPEDVSAEEWRERERIWEKAIPRQISEKCLTFNLFDGQPYMHANESVWDIICADDLEKRLNRTARSKYIKEKTSGIEEISDVMRIITEYDEDSTIREKSKNEIKHLIIPIYRNSMVPSLD